MRRSRRRNRIVVWSIALIVALLITLDHAGVFGFRGNDWTNFDHRSVRMSRVISGDTFVADGETIQLLGVNAPEGQLHWSAEAANYLAARLKDRSVILKLDGTQTRSETGALLAYIFVTDGDCLNVDIVRDGQAYADRRAKHSMESPIELVENEARKKKRGLWNGLQNDQMPAWRIDWLKHRFAATHSS